tara:strand:+ start:387 stop:488 length:102 start_codon:yes stop_codon:yes gene_type:complete
MPAKPIVEAQIGGLLVSGGKKGHVITFAITSIQ